MLGARNATWNVRYFEISLEVIFWLKVRQKEQEFASRSPLPPETQTVYSIGFNMGRQLDELSVFFSGDQPFMSHHCVIVTFCVSRRRCKMYCGHARLCVCLSVCPRPYAHTTARIRM